MASTCAAASFKCEQLKTGIHVSASVAELGTFSHLTEIENVKEVIMNDTRKENKQFTCGLYHTNLF